MAKKHSFKVGDKIAYSVQFLRSICESHGEMARARGEIAVLHDYGSITLAAIKWTTKDQGADKVNVGNLAKVGPNRKFCNVD